MKIDNWIKKNWADPVWSKVFAGIILSIILWFITQIFKIANSLIDSSEISEWSSNISVWLGKSSEISNISLVLFLIVFGIALTYIIHNLITRFWLGRTDTYYSSSEKFIVRGTYSFNLDLGIQAKGWEDSDFWWQQKDNIRRSIVPKNGAKFCVIGQTQLKNISRLGLEKLTYSDSEIRADDNHSNQIPDGTNLAYITKESRYGVMKILNYGYNLEIMFYTFKNN